MFQKYLRSYASSVLQGALPGGPGGAGGAGGLVSNLHTLLNDGHHDARWELVYTNIALTIFMSL